MKRVLLKISGEALKGKKDFGYSSDMLKQVASDVYDLNKLGYQISIVVGGGNIFRGVNGKETGIQRVNSDYMGMLATVMNAIALGDALSHKGLKVKVMSAIKMDSVVEPYSYKRAISFLDNGEVVVFGGGTGNPFFTTDTAATLRAIEMNCDMLLKATKVIGVYNKDPFKFEDAVLYKELSYNEAMEKNLKIMDLTAFALASDNQLKITVFNLNESGNLIKAVKGETGTLVN